MNLYAPPSPGPTPSDELGPGTPSPSVSVSTTDSGKLPTTGPGDGPWGILTVGLVLVVAGAALAAWMRRARARA